MVFLLLLILCALFFLICYVGTGEQKNIRSFYSYPDAVQEIVRQMPQYKNKIKPKGNPVVGFIYNLAYFGVLLFIFGLAVKSGSFLKNFVSLTILGQGLNLFDLVVIDLIWWRNSKRVRFEGTKDNDEIYKSPKKHVEAFLRAVVLFLIIAAADGYLLTLI